uniref:Uncharacterized protein n=1 Tax=Arundo donax TaxID=35708 RepID=A0A0A8YB55_ARUDO
MGGPPPSGAEAATPADAMAAGCTAEAAGR